MSKIPERPRRQRSRWAVRTVVPTLAGRAACSTPEARAVFDTAEDQRSNCEVRTAAAAICGTCSLSVTCAWRIHPPSRRSRAKAAKK